MEQLEQAINMYSLYTSLWKSAKEMTAGAGVADGTTLVFNEAYVDNAFLSQGVPPENLSSAKDFAVTVNWLVRNDGGYSITKHCLFRYNALRRRV